jgi:beta-lactamase regulating signal transducer with metallopeptidase domain
MVGEILLTLAKATILSSLAILCVALLRTRLRKLAGARAAYWLWLSVPAITLTLLLPAPSQLLLLGQMPVEMSISSIVPATFTEPMPSGNLLMQLALAGWLVGSVVLLTGLLARQLAFMRLLGPLTPAAHGIFHGAHARTPMLIGLFRPRIVVPADFEARYAPAEQKLVLAHERAHQERRDILVSALAFLSLCVFWFNPLMYLALSWLRRDQELACDEHVLSNAPAADAGARRVYADTLLKTQLAAESAWRMPIGCHWQSTHPLKERIMMLKNPLPGRSRRFAGIGLILGLTVLTSYLSWAGQSTAVEGQSILVDIKVTINVPDTNEVRALATRYLVHSGEEIKDPDGRPLEFACTPYLPDVMERKTDWSAIKARGIPIPAAGQILLDCAIRERGTVVQSPAVMIYDGKQGHIETNIAGREYRMEVSATTSAERIADANREVAAR